MPNSGVYLIGAGGSGVYSACMQSKPMSTLLVDDNKTFLNALLGVLGQVAGVHVVACAADGVEALELVQRWQPELMLLDLSMPRLGGLELATRLSGQPGAPIMVMLSMHDSDAYRQAAKDAGVRAFVNKDNVMSELVPLLQSLVADRPQTQQEKETP